MTPELLAAAPIVAVIQPTGNESVHWNNATNTPWTSDEATRPAMIYRDQEVSVIRVLKGSLKSTEWVRSVGGTVGDTEFVLEGGSHMEPNRAYLVYLGWEDTPTQDGSQRFLGVYGQAGGVFASESNGDWTNELSGVTVSEDDVNSTTP